MDLLLLGNLIVAICTNIVTLITNIVVKRTNIVVIGVNSECVLTSVSNVFGCVEFCEMVMCTRIMF